MLSNQAHDYKVDMLTKTGFDSEQSVKPEGTDN